MILMSGISIKIIGGKLLRIIHFCKLTWVQPCYRVDVDMDKNNIREPITIKIMDERLSAQYFQQTGVVSSLL